MLLNNPLDSILGQSSKVKMLRFLTRTGAELNGREIAKALGLSHVKCHTALQEFAGHGLVTMRRVGKSILYKLNEDNLLSREVIRPLFEKEQGLPGKVAEKILDEFTGERPLSIILFGSMARGGARQDSDIDILVVVRDGGEAQKAEEILAKASVKVAKELGNQLNPLVRDKKSLRLEVKKQSGVYAEIAKSGKRLYGKSIGELFSNAC